MVIVACVLVMTMVEVLVVEVLVPQAVWSLKTRALTEQVWVDECDGEEEGLADVLMDDNTIASVARPGTSLRSAPPSSAGGPSQTFR